MADPQHLNRNVPDLTAERPPGAPRWVKASGIVVIALVLLFFIMHFTGLAPTMQHGAPPP